MSQDVRSKNETTRELLIKHCRTYPDLRPEDILKYIFQSVFGCEHSVSDKETATEYIRKEYQAVCKTDPPLTEPLDGEYSRVHLSHLNTGLKPETLALLFRLSAQKTADGDTAREDKLRIVRELTDERLLPFERRELDREIDKWKNAGYPAIHHSDIFRAKYRPAYRVISDRYAKYTDIFAEIDKRAEGSTTVIAIEGGSASGKTTLSEILSEVYDCNVFHMDDFFLRPEQRTPQRLSEIGGNVDRERFSDEILPSLGKNEAVSYRRFDCSTRSLGDVITVPPKRLTIIEGAYSTHPSFGKYYDISIFLDIDPEYQIIRIEKRNTPELAKRFFNEWIPLENTYFIQTGTKSKADLVLKVRKSSR